MRNISAERRGKVKKVGKKEIGLMQESGQIFSSLMYITELELNCWILMKKPGSSQLGCSPTFGACLSLLLRCWYQGLLQWT